MRKVYFFAVALIVTACMTLTVYANTSYFGDGSDNKFGHVLNADWSTWWDNTTTGYGELHIYKSSDIAPMSFLSVSLYKGSNLVGFGYDKNYLLDNFCYVCGRKANKVQSKATVYKNGKPTYTNDMTITDN